MKTWLQWVSTDRSYAKCVLGNKTLTLPTQDNGWLSASRPDAAGQINNKVLASQSLYWTLLLTEGVLSKQPPPYPTIATIGNKIVETLYLNRVTLENKRIRTPPLSPPFQVGVFVVFYR